MSEFSEVRVTSVCPECGVQLRFIGEPRDATREFLAWLVRHGHGDHDTIEVSVSYRVERSLDNLEIRFTKEVGDE